MEKKLKVAYVQFEGRVTKLQDKTIHIGAAALYSDKELTQIMGLEVSELTNFEENKKDKFDVYRNRLGEYATALKLIHKYQNDLIRNDYDVVVLCPSSSKMWSWLSGKLVPAQIRDLFENINRQFRLDGQYQLDICVGLSEDLADKKAYKFCKPEYIGAQICRVRRGAHIMTAAEVEAARQAKLEQLKKQEAAVLDADGVSIYDIMQSNQGSEFEPKIEFANA